MAAGAAVTKLINLQRTAAQVSRPGDNFTGGVSAHLALPIRRNDQKLDCKLRSGGPETAARLVLVSTPHPSPLWSTVSQNKHLVDDIEFDYRNTENMEVPPVPTRNEGKH